jgi:hypothetical protein
MKKLVMIAVLLVSAMSAQAKIGDTFRQLVSRFGNYEADDAGNLTFQRDGGKVYVMLSAYTNRCVVETYENDYMLDLDGPPKGPPRPEIIRGILNVESPNDTWVEIAPIYGGQYCLQAQRARYIAVLKHWDKIGAWLLMVGEEQTVLKMASRYVARKVTETPTPAPYVPPATPQPTAAPRYVPRDPSRPPNDCAIVAAQAYAKLKPNTYWCQIMGVHFETDTDVFNHAVVLYKYQPNGPVFVYDARGSVETRTTSERLEDLAEAVKPFMASLIGRYPTTVTLRPLTEDEAQRYQGSVTVKRRPASR